MQFLNDRVLQLAMYGKGYDNHSGVISNGERLLLAIVTHHEPKLCVDVGANVGHYSRWLLENTGARVVAFEPLPKAFAGLTSLKAIFGERFHPLNKGVGDTAGAFDLYYGAEDSELATLSPEVNAIGFVGSHNVNRMEVTVVTLDEVFDTLGPAWAGDIDLLKIDTEGFEYEVLLGAGSLIRDRHPKFIQIEFNLHQLFKGQSLHSMAERLAGYRAYQLLPYGKGLHPIDPHVAESNFYCYSNFVFVRDDIQI